MDQAEPGWPGARAEARGLKVAMYLHDLSGGGVERMRLHLARALRDLGAEVSLVLHAADGPHRAAVPAGVAVHVLGGRRVAHDIAPLAALVRRARPDVLLSSLGHNNVAAALAGVLARGATRVILTQHNALSEEARGATHRAIPLAYRLVAPLVAGFVAVSHGVAEDMARRCGIARRRIAVVHNPVLDPDFAARAAAPLDHLWFEDADVPVFVTAGRLVAQKNHEALLRAFARVRARRRARLIVLGEGPLGGELRALADALGLGDDVSFPGFVANPLPYLRRAAAFVLSSRHEGFGNVIVEALGCGTPVIATDCPHGPAEILERGRVGVLVPVGDVAALAAAMLEDLRRRFPAPALRARAAMFTAEASAAAYLRVMRAAGA